MLPLCRQVREMIGFADRRELWRLAGYLAVVAVDGHRPFGRRCLDRLAAAV
jgi:hypothetical protein